LSVQAQDGVPGSTLELYREAIRLRSQHLRNVEGFEWADTEGDVLCFERGQIRVMVNLGATPVPLPVGEVLIASDQVEGTLGRDTAVWVMTAPRHA
jgi:alpha-glucosidase